VWGRSTRWVLDATAVTAFGGSEEVVAAAAAEGAVDVFEVEDSVDRTVA
jgi:hypothetical protein